MTEPIIGRHGARGSAIQSWESTTNEYRWRPTLSGTVTDHTPPLSTRVIGVSSTLHPLKSPTNDTLAACGAMKRNVITLTVSETGTRAIGSAGTACGSPVEVRPSRLLTNVPPNTPMPTRPAASARLAIGDAEMSLGSMRRCQKRRRGAGSARTASMMRVRAAGPMTTGRRASRAIHSTYV